MNLNYESDVKNANNIKDLILETIEKEGYLRASAQELSAKFVIVLKNKGLFGRIYDKIFKEEDEKDNTFYYKVLVDPNIDINKNAN